MKSIPVFTLLILLCPFILAQEIQVRERGNLVLEDIPEVPDSVLDRLHQYNATRSASIAGWLPDGSGMLIRTQFGETRQLHRVEHPGGARHQITFFTEPIGGLSMGKGERNGMIYSRDVGGSEYYQMFYHDLANGKSRMISDGKSRYGLGPWANDQKHYAFSSTARNNRDTDVYVADISSDEPPRIVTTETGSWRASEFSPDDKWLLVGRYISIVETQVVLVNLETGEKRRLFADEKGYYGGGSFSPDGKGIYFTSNTGSEFRQLRYLDLDNNQVKVLSDHINWDVGGLELSDDGNYLVMTANEGGISKLHLYDLKQGKWLPQPKLPVGQVYGPNFKPGTHQLALTISTAQSPGDVYVLDLDSGKLTRWTFSEVGGLDTSKFEAAELIHFPTFDEVDGKPRMIPAFINKPPGDGPFPVVVNIHGGPEGQSRPGFSSQNMYLVHELGLATISPNVRGSSGYGKTYLQLDNGFKREDSVKDIGSLLDWIKEQPDLDEDRVVVMGGSYGGYMVLASMVHFNDRLRAGVDIVGISNFVSFLKNTKSYRRDLRRVEYGDERDEAMRAHLEKISPNNNAHKISKPLLIAQGLNDPRVPASEAEQMVAAIRKNGGDVWYFLAKDEGHGFRKKTNSDYYRGVVSMFLEKHLLDRPSGDMGN